MRLLPPKQLNDKINQQKKNEIDAGLFIAKKIDLLREQLADEQKKTDEGRMEMKLRFTEFASGLSIKKESLENEVKKLEKTREELLKPLDEERDKVKSEKIQQEFFSKIILRNQEEVLKKQEELKKKQDEIVKLSKKTVENLEQAEKKHAQADKNKGEREEELFKAHQEKMEATREFENIRASLQHKEYVLNEKLAGIELIREKLKKKEKELKTHEQRLSYRREH